MNAIDGKLKSSILTRNDIVHINKWLNEAKNDLGESSTPKIIYCASRDGWHIDDFHSKCDEKGPTITVVNGVVPNVVN